MLLTDWSRRLLTDRRLGSRRILLSPVLDLVRLADVIERSCGHAAERRCLWIALTTDWLLRGWFFTGTAGLLPLRLLLPGPLDLLLAGALLLPDPLLLGPLPLALRLGASQPFLLLALSLPLSVGLPLLLYLSLLLGLMLLRLPLLIRLTLAIFVRAALLFLSRALFLLLPGALFLLGPLPLLLLALLPVAFFRLTALLLVLLVRLSVRGLDVVKRPRSHGPGRQRWHQQRRAQRHAPPPSGLPFHRVPSTTRKQLPNHDRCS